MKVEYRLFEVSVGSAKELGQKFQSLGQEGWIFAGSLPPGQLPNYAKNILVFYRTLSTKDDAMNQFKNMFGGGLG